MCCFFVIFTASLFFRFDRPISIEITVKTCIRMAFTRCVMCIRSHRKFISFGSTWRWWLGVCLACMLNDEFNGKGTYEILMHFTQTTLYFIHCRRSAIGNTVTGMKWIFYTRHTIATVSVFTMQSRKVLTSKSTLHVLMYIGASVLDSWNATFDPIFNTLVISISSFLVSRIKRFSKRTEMKWVDQTGPWSFND